MSNATYLVHSWQDSTGRDAPHSARVVRALQLDKQMPVGKQGKAALLDSSALTSFLLADATGDSISTAAQRSKIWGSIVRDYSNGVATSRGRSQAEIAWWNWRDSEHGEAEASDSRACSNVLPGANFREGLSALLKRISDPTPNVPLYGDKLVTFSELASYVQLHIDLRLGENEGPTAIVHTSHRQDRYSMQVQPVVARCPIKSVITIEVRHLIVLARVLEAAKARTTSAQSVPPVPPAFVAGAGNGNAEAVGTAPAPTPNHPSSPADCTAAHTHQEPDTNNPEASVCECGCARAARGVSLSQLAHGGSLAHLIQRHDRDSVAGVA